LVDEDIIILLHFSCRVTGYISYHTPIDTVYQYLQLSY